MVRILDYTRMLLFRPLFIVVLIASQTYTTAWSQDSKLTKYSMVEILKRNEDLIKSMHCVFTLETYETSPGMIPLIRQHIKSSGKKDGEIKRYIVNNEFAARNTFSVEWWRKGTAERREYLDTGNQSNRKSIAFDGQVYRAIQRRGEQALGTIGSKESSHWNSKNDIVPYSFLFQFQNEYFSDLLSKATECTISQENSHTSAFFRHPRIDFVWFKLIFDSTGRLVERHMIRKHPDDKDKRVYETHQLSNYASIENGYGQTVLFPKEVRYAYSMGTTPSGTQIVYMTQKATVSKIEMNPELPDALFILDFPSNIKVYDELTGQGWIEPGTPLPVAPLPIANHKSYYIIIAIALALCLVVVLYAIRRRLVAE